MIKPKSRKQYGVFFGPEPPGLRLLFSSYRLARKAISDRHLGMKVVYAPSFISLKGDWTQHVYCIDRRVDPPLSRVATITV